MITTILRYIWLKIDGEHYKVPRDPFAVPMYYACNICYGHHPEGTCCPSADVARTGEEK